MISSNTTINYHAVFLNKTITSFRLNYTVFKKKINPCEMECDNIFFAVLLGCSSFIFSSVIVVDLFFVQIIFLKYCHVVSHVVEKVIHLKIKSIVVLFTI